MMLFAAVVLPLVVAAQDVTPDAAASCSVPPLPVAGSTIERRGIVYTNRISKVPGESQTFDFFRPNDTRKRPVIVFVHGGGWVSGTAGSHADTARRYVSLGYAVANFNYPLVKQYNGQWVNQFPVPVQGLRCGLRYLRKNASSLNIDLTRVVTSGGSAGGNLSSLLAYAGAADSSRLDSDECEHKTTPLPSVAAHLSYSGVYALRTATAFDRPGAFHFLGRPGCDPEITDPALEPQSCRDWRWKQAPFASPRVYVTPSAPPTFAVHSIDDPVVNSIQLKLLGDALNAQGVDNELVMVSGNDHVPATFGTTEPVRSTMCRMMAFLTRVLGPP